MDDESSRYRVRLIDDREFGPVPMAQVVQWAREGRVPLNAKIVNDSTGEARPVNDYPQLGLTVAAPPTVQGQVVRKKHEAPALIPYTNAPALASYYVGVGSIVCLVGLLAAPVAIILGIVGLIKVKSDPSVKGTAHAIVGIIIGVLSIVAHLAAYYFIVNS